MIILQHILTKIIIIFFITNNLDKQLTTTPLESPSYKPYWAINRVCFKYELQIESESLQIQLLLLHDVQPVQLQHALHRIQRLHVQWR